MKTHETKARELTNLLARDLQSIQYHEESDYPKQTDCVALPPLAMKIAKVPAPRQSSKPSSWRDWGTPILKTMT